MTRDDMILVRGVEKRGTAAPVLHERVGRVLRVHDDIGGVEYAVLSHFCYVEGYHQLGRSLPTGRRQWSDGSLTDAIDFALTSECRPLFTL